MTKINPKTTWSCRCGQQSEIPAKLLLFNQVECSNCNNYSFLKDGKPQEWMLVPRPKIIRDRWVVRSQSCSLSFKFSVWSEASLLAKTLNEMEAMRDELKRLKQHLVDADGVARKRGDDFGLCDAIDNFGNPYPSQTCADDIRRCLDEGMRPYGNAA